MSQTTDPSQATPQFSLNYQDKQPSFKQETAPTKAQLKGEQKLGTPGGILGQGKEKPPSLQGAINEYMAPYVSELTSLGPEYAKEMAFLKPYMEGNPAGGTQAAVAQEYGGSGVKAQQPTPQSEALESASLANAKAEEAFVPGFGALAKGARQQEQTTSYADVLNAVLGASKNELLYGSVPNFAAVSGGATSPVAQFPASVQALFNQIQTSEGGGSTIGVTPQIASQQLAQQQQPSNTPGTVGGTLGGGSGGTTTNIQ